MSRNRLLILSVALLTIAAQLFIPTSMASRYEDILQTGERYLFKVEPRDPADPFKGRYVVLDFPISSGAIKDLENPVIITELPRKTAAYAIIDRDSDSIARVRDIQKEPPKHQNYVRIKSSYSYNEKYNITLPFDRYYAEESKAPKIESLLWTRVAGQNVEFYADVRIKNGYAVIAELYVDDIAILDYLEQQQSR
ncbi:MAG: putative membrane-anchored protein [Arenicella sp.]|jgi:uncharacterized membrane-anchored protein